MVYLHSIQEMSVPLLLSKIASQRLAALRLEPPFFQYEKDPVGFIQNVLGVEYLTPEQITIAESVRDNIETNVQSCHGSGKSFISAMLVLYWVFAVGGVALSTAPTRSQVNDILWAEIRRMYDRHKKKLGGNRGELFIKLSETANAKGFTVRDYSYDDFQGRHADKLFLIQDESGGIKRAVNDGFEASLTGANNRGLRIGNPVVSGTPFEEACKKHHIRISAWSHINVKWAYELCSDGIHRLKREVADAILDVNREVRPQSQWPEWCPRDQIPGAISISWIEATRAKGENSNFWQSRIEAFFPTDSEQSVIPRSWVTSSRARYDADPAHWDAIAARFQPRYGLDVGDGEDSHALAKWRGPVLYMCEAYPTRGDRQDVSRTVSLAAHAAINEEGVIVVDQIGVGAGALSMLLDYGHSAVAAFWGNAADDSVAFANRKAEQFWKLREALRNEEVALAPLGKYEDELIEDLAGTYYEITTSGKIKIEDKEAVRKRLHRSTNCGDAVVIAFSASMPVYDVSHNVGW